MHLSQMYAAGSQQGSWAPQPFVMDVEFRCAKAAHGRRSAKLPAGSGSSERQIDTPQAKLKLRRLMRRTVSRVENPSRYGHGTDVLVNLNRLGNHTELDVSESDDDEEPKKMRTPRQ